ncbi:MAG: sterol desaturase family protein [Anaerolineae bacterium]|jgi:sterol desaturase/sphingolipid hydroxylase (fatty acid hydroxylase superfamily)
MAKYHVKIVHSKTPIRLFKSDLLEFFTHIHPAVILVIWVPLIGFFLVRAVLDRTAGAWGIATIPLGFLAGLFLWTLTEYTLHRFVFHFPPRNAWQEKVSFLFHGIHHAQPQVKTRLVMPPAVSIPLALLFFGLFYLILDVALGLDAWLAPTFAGFLSGYVAYDMIHYATHHLTMRRGYWKFLKRYHMQHHYKTPDQRFGVSSPLWDLAFGTRPGGRKR